MSNEPNRPLRSFGVAGLSVALWENTHDTEEGGQRTSRTVSVRRSFFNRKEGRFDEQTITIAMSDVACLRHLLARMEQAVVDERP
jgi:hypothetical protein